VRISMRVQGPHGAHAWTARVHIHERGSCQDGDPPFMSAVGHFAPARRATRTPT
jgi:Cu/Zn superoxide dismutase